MQQHNNVYERIHATLTWQRVVAFNVILFLVTVIPLSVRLAQQDTENRSSAAETPNPIVIPPPSYPVSPPKIERVTEWFGKRGDTIVVLGSNFGAYQWGSKVYVGSTEAEPSNIIRWSDSVLEVQIPSSARTGQVWVVVNNRQSVWEGSLLLTDVARSAQVKLTSGGTTIGNVSLVNAAGVTRGMIELSHVSEPVTAIVNDGNVANQSQTSDSLGKKTMIQFELSNPLSSNATQIMELSYPGIGGLTILRAELYDSQGNLVPVFADPLTVKIW